MIFSFTREEEAQIKQFIEKTREELEQRGIKQVEPTDKAIISEFVGDFVAMIDGFENARFSVLDNQKKIIENAKSTAEEAIIFTYNSFNNSFNMFIYRLQKSCLLFFCWIWIIHRFNSFILINNNKKFNSRRNFIRGHIYIIWI